MQLAGADTSAVVSSQPRRQSSHVLTIAEPVTVFHYEVLTVGDRKVAQITTKILYLSIFLIAVSIVQFIIEWNSSDLSKMSVITNLIFDLSLPACGIIGVRDKNITCIQYFCCCNYFCNFG